MELLIIIGIVGLFTQEYECCLASVTTRALRVLIPRLIAFSGGKGQNTVLRAISTRVGFRSCFWPHMRGGTTKVEPPVPFIRKKMFQRFIIIGFVLLILSCGNGKGGKIKEPYDGGHGIGIDTATVNEIQRYEDSMPAKDPVNESPKMESSSSSSREIQESDNMRGFDPASEDDMDDNGMSRFMENTDDEGWD